MRRQTSVRWWVVGGIAGAVIVFATIAALVFTWRDATRERDAALGWQRQSYEVMVLSRTLDASIGKSEASLGRFVVSGDKAVGRLFVDQWAQAGTLLDRLDRQITDPRTQRLIDALREAYGARGTELTDIALRTNYEQNAQALSKYYTAGRSDSLRRITQLLDRVSDNERAVLAQRTARAEATIARSNTFGTILSGFGFVLVVGMGFLVWTALRAWSQRLTEEVRNDELEDAVAARTSELSEVAAQLRAEMATREATEARLRQAQKMEAVGQLTGGIAHDFNNMLAVVMGGIELAQRRIVRGGEAEPHLASALEGATRAAALTKRLLAFSRAEPAMPAAADPNMLLADMAELLDRTIGDTIEVRVLPTARPWPVFVDPHQFENAVLNLSVNARDAMPAGGILTIAVDNTSLAAGQVDGASAGDYIRIAVSDTGTGMSEAIRERVFEPFFTTKPVGQGTGLGLSQVFGFVKQSRGAVSVESVLGQGTTVSLFLPRSAALPKVVTRSERSLPMGRPRAPRTILVVEDDPRVLAATAEALREIGHRPIACALPSEAHQCLIDHPDIALIVSDVLMPGMTGPELVEALRHDHASIPVLFVTGFAGDIPEGAFGGHRVLRKPFTMAELDAAVADLIDPRAARAA
ncbi:MAG: ATP-binding protein [Sphingomonadaceae bacterium]